jgi:hypothetical protein
MIGLAEAVCSVIPAQAEIQCGTSLRLVTATSSRCSFFMPEAWQLLAGRFQSLSDDTPGNDAPAQPSKGCINPLTFRALLISP